MLTEDQLVDMLTQLASYLPMWGWGVVLVVAIVCWLSSKYMRVPGEGDSFWYRALYTVTTALPRLVQKVLERRKLQKTVSVDGKR